MRKKPKYALLTPIVEPIDPQRLADVDALRPGDRIIIDRFGRLPLVAQQDYDAVVISVYRRKGDWPIVEVRLSEDESSDVLGKHIRRAPA